MSRPFLTFLAVLSALAISLIAAAWILLVLPAFSGLRSALISDFLTRQVGQPVIVNGGTQVDLGLTMGVRVTDVVLPSENIERMALATLGLFEMDLELLALFGSGRVLDNLRMDSAAVRLVTLNDGTTSWAGAGGLQGPDVPGSETRNGPSVLAFLGDRSLVFSSLQLVVDDRQTGFRFDFELDELTHLLADDDRSGSLAANGRMNGLAFNIEGTFPERESISFRAGVGDVRVALNASPTPTEQRGAYSGHVEVDTGALGDILEAFDLERSQEGRGRFTAEFTTGPELLRIDRFEGTVELAEGGAAKVEGSVGDLWTFDAFDFSTQARLHPDGVPLPPAADFSDLVLSGFDAHIVGLDRAIRIERAVLRTNAFDLGLDNIGPASIGRIYRSSDGRLVLDDIGLQLGPTQAPHLLVTGQVSDAIRLRDIAFDGVASIPIPLLVSNLSDDSAKFGRLDSEFSINDTGGYVGLTHLSARSGGTDLWSLGASASWPDLTSFDGVEIALTFAVPDSRAFLGGLGLKPVKTGGMTLHFDLGARDGRVKTDVEVSAGKSRLELKVDHSLANAVPYVRGNLTSEKIDLADVGNATAFFIELARIGQGARMEGGREVQRFVLEDTREVQPLVLEDARDVEPLVLPKRVGIEILADLFDVEMLLREADLEIAIEIPNLVVQKGVSSLSSTVVAKNGKVQAGPLALNYGGGFFRLGAGMDVIAAPGAITIAGSTGGWDFGEILRAVGMDLDASGVLKSDFELTGKFAAPLVFARSATGTAQVSMSGGTIATSLLELAGLGIFPWLFSGELWRGYTKISCLEAPLRIRRGAISTDRTVLETERVQLVVRGTVDLAGDKITLRAEPRPIGEPFSESPWPLEITGSLAAPEISVRNEPSNTDEFGNLSLPAERTPCRPDILQLQ